MNITFYHLIFLIYKRLTFFLNSSLVSFYFCSQSATLQTLNTKTRTDYYGFKCRKNLDRFCGIHQLTDKTFQTRWFGEQSNSEEVSELTEKFLLVTRLLHQNHWPTILLKMNQSLKLAITSSFERRHASCRIIETVVSELVPFFRVSAEHAYNDAEGDRTLSDWQERSKENSPVKCVNLIVNFLQMIRLFVKLSKLFIVFNF